MSVARGAEGSGAEGVVSEVGCGFEEDLDLDLEAERGEMVYLLVMRV